MAIKDSFFSKTVIAKKYIMGNYTRSSLLLSSNSTTDKCICCSESHRIYNCSKLKNMSTSERLTFVRNARLCFNCLSTSHKSNICNFTFSYFECKRRHNGLLHFNRAINSEGAQKQNEEQPPELIQSLSSQISNTSSLTSLLVRTQKEYVFLPTALIMVLDKFGVQRNCKVVLDSGSQVNFISTKLQNVLQLSGEKVILPVSGIGPNHKNLHTSPISSIYVYD